MTLDELKNEWQQEAEKKSEPQLEKMLQQRASSVFAKIKLRAVIESMALLLVLVVFFTGLDAHLNATWVNILFALAVLIGIANNAILYRRTMVNARGDNLTASLQQVDNQLQWQIRLATVFSALLFVGTFAFLLLRVPMTDQKLFLVLLVLPITIGVRTWFEVRQWQQHRMLVRHSLEELGE